MEQEIGKPKLRILGALILIVLGAIIAGVFWNSGYVKEKRVESHYNKALYYYNAKDYVSAEQEFRKAIDIDPYAYEAQKSREKLVDTLYKLGRVEEAESLKKILPITETVVYGREAESMMETPTEFLSGELPITFLVFTALGLLFILGAAKFLGCAIPLSSVPLLSIVVMINEFLAVISLKNPFSPLMYIIYIVHFAFLMWVFGKVLEVEPQYAFILTSIYSVLVEGLPFLFLVLFFD